MSDAAKSDALTGVVARAAEACAEALQAVRLQERDGWLAQAELTLDQAAHQAATAVRLLGERARDGAAAPVRK